MRTTLQLDDRVVAVARERARREGVSLGRAVSDLALLGMAAPITTAPSRKGIPVFSPPPGVTPPPVTADLIAEHRDDTP